MSNQKDTLKVVKSSIWTVAILLGGALLILFIADKYISSMNESYMGQVLPFVSGLESFGYMIVEGLGFILIILIMAYIILRKSSKKTEEKIPENIPA